MSLWVHGTDMRSAIVPHYCPPGPIPPPLIRRAASDRKKKTYSHRVPRYSSVRGPVLTLEAAVALLPVGAVMVVV